MFNNKVSPDKINHKNAKKYCQIVLFSSKKALVVCYSALQSGLSIFAENQNKISHTFCKLILAKVSTPCILPSHTGFKNIFTTYHCFIISFNEFIKCPHQFWIPNLRKNLNECLLWFLFNWQTEKKLLFGTSKKFLFFFNFSNWDKFVDKIGENIRWIRYLGGNYVSSLEILIDKYSMSCSIKSSFISPSD